MASLLEDFDHRVRKIETATTLNEIQGKFRLFKFRKFCALLFFPDIYISSKRTKITQPGSSEKLIRVEKTEEHQEDEQIPQEVPQEALSKNEKFRQELMAIQKKNLVDKDRYYFIKTLQHI